MTPPVPAPVAAAHVAVGEATVAEAATSPAVLAWDTSVVPALAKFVELSAEVAPLVAEQAQEVRTAFDRTHDIVQAASMCQPPAEGSVSHAYTALFQPLQAQLQRVMDIREQNRSHTSLFNHLSTVSEGIPALGWVAVERTPAPYILDMKESAQFYGNRVMRDYKDGYVVCAYPATRSTSSGSARSPTCWTRWPRT